MTTTLKLNFLIVFVIFCVISLKSHELLEEDEEFEYETNFVPSKNNTSAEAPSDPAKAAKDTGIFPQFVAGIPPLEITALELSALAILTLFVIQYIWGKKANYNLAKTWIVAQKDYLENNFSTVGITEKEVLVLQISCCYFQSWATGRTNLNSMQLDLKLAPRHDLLCFWLLGMVSSVSTYSDVVTLTICLPSMPCVCFGVSRKKDFFSKTDLKALCKPRKVAGMPDKLLVYSDSAEVVDVILGGIQNKACFGHVLTVHCSDSMEDFKGENMLILEYQIPKKTVEVQKETILNVTRLALDLVDHVSSMRLSEKARQTATAARQEAEKKRLKETESERQEAQSKKKQEDRKREEEELAKMTPEQRRKREERNAKKEQKKKDPKVKMMRI
eukprot:Platyproteum_vivax@DN4239_c0_g1_i1.p1